MRRLNNSIKSALGVIFLGGVMFSFYSFSQPGGFGGGGFAAQLEARGLAEAFKGVSIDGTLQEELFPIISTGIDTTSLIEATENFLNGLTLEQRERVLFPIDDVEWRKWSNMHIYARDGISFEEMNDVQRATAFDLLQSSLSSKGYDLTRDIMRLNHTLAELTDDNFDEFGEWKYSLTIMGTPSETEPWGWQLDGHHLVINFFVLGDQVVMTPAFWGSEPVIASSGKYEGVSILQEEQSIGYTLINSLTEEQRKIAIISGEKTGNNALAQAFEDNLQLDYAGIEVSSFSMVQQSHLLSLVSMYINNMREEEAVVKMNEVIEFLDDTYFAWIGGINEDDVFYYRIQSPVLLIEFDHQTPFALRHLYEAGVPYKEHIHSVVRTPNGNDYGKDLLRQHYLDHPH